MPTFSVPDDDDESEKGGSVGAEMSRLDLNRRSRSRQRAHGDDETVDTKHEPDTKCKLIVRLPIKATESKWGRITAQSHKTKTKPDSDFHERLKDLERRLNEQKQSGAKRAAAKGIQKKRKANAGGFNAQGQWLARKRRRLEHLRAPSDDVEDDNSTGNRWTYIQKLGSGSFGEVTLWAQFDEDGNIIDRLAAKDTEIGEQSRLENITIYASPAN